MTTHYRKLLETLKPHKVHVMHGGQIVETGDLEIATHIEELGFGEFIGEEDDASNRTY